MKSIGIGSVVVLLSLLAGSVEGVVPEGVTKFENDFAGWSEMVGTSTLINFDSIVASSTTPIVGNEFSSFPGNPTFACIQGQGVFVREDELLARVSLPNYLMANGSSIPNDNGVIRVMFSQPITALGAFFFDVEEDYPTSGFALTPDSPPEVNFSGNQGNRSQAFLGFVTDTPVSAVDIHLASRTGGDGASLDDLRYSVVPEPSTIALLGIGILTIALGWQYRRELT